MNKPSKIVLIIVAVLLAITVLPLLALVLLVDPNSFKPQIVAAVKEQTGRDFRIDGKLGWSFYPVLGIELGSSQLGNAQGFGDKPMLALKSVAVGVELLPLLEREINVSQLRLEQPQINLGVDKSGRSNWDDILEKQKQISAAATAPTSSSPPDANNANANPTDDGKASPPLRVAISGVEIVDGTVSWNDAENGQSVQVSKLNLETGAINPLKPVDIKLAMYVHSAAPALDGDVKLGSSVLFDTVAQALTLQQTELTVELAGKDIPGGKQTFTMKMNSITANLDKQTLAIPSLYIGIAGVELQASVDGAQIIDKPQFSGQLSLAEISLRKLLGNLDITLPEMADNKALGKFDFSSRFTATPQQVDIAQIKMTLDDSTISGDLKAGLGDITHLGFDLQLDGINADRYLPPPAPTAGATSSAAQADSAVAQPAQVDDSATFAPLDTMAVNGKVSIGKLRVQNLDMTDAVLVVKTQGRKVTIEPLKAALYGGGAVIKASIDGSGRRAQGEAAIMLLKLNVGEFLDAYMQKRGPIEGNGNILATVNFVGLDGNSIMSSASGKGELRFLDGAVRGFNIAQEIRNALALVKKQPRQDAPKKTDFTELVVPFTIDKGVLSWHDMTASSPLLRIGSKGDFNLATQKVDTTVDASVVSTLKGQGGDPLNELAGFLVPLKVRGAMDDPKISIDIKKVLAQTKLGEKQKALEAKVDERKAELKEKADEKKDEAKKKAGEELKRGLDKLFNKKKE